MVWSNLLRIVESLFAALLGVLLSGCAHTSAMDLAAADPWPGFGRAGCFAGPGLRRGYDGELSPGDSAAMRGPWLALGSLTRAELRRIGVERRFIESDMRTGVLVERRDSLEQTYGNWVEVSPDSVSFREGSTMPSVDWRLRRTPEGLEGEGVMVHDSFVSGQTKPSVSRWRVVLVRVPCAAVPARRWTPAVSFRAAAP